MFGMRILYLLPLFVFVEFTDQKVLDDYIRHYEELTYDTVDLHDRHLRAKRSTTDKSLDLKFQAHHRDFHLRLKPSQSIFTKDHKLRHSNGSEEWVDTSFIYDGIVEGSPGSSVHGAVIQGIFRGIVRIPGDTIYYIEPSHRFFSKKNFKNKSFHSVIYKEEHIRLDPFRHKRSLHNNYGSCANDLHQAWMQRVSESAVQHNRARRSEFDDFHDKYSASANAEFPRNKRATTSCNIGTQNTCYLYLRSDPMLYNELRSNLQNDIAARDEILAFFASHVEAISNIYRNTIFKQYSTDKPCYTNIQFEVKRTSIMTDESENCNNQLRKNSFCNPNIDVSNFLNLNSLVNHNEFCLAYIFTYRDFTQGTLGLAWVGSPSRNAGGICEKWKEYTEGSDRVYKSLNTGIVTIVNYGKRVAPRVSQLTFAHEVGHNFGSPHDNGAVCAPFGTSRSDASDGNYIMFASATQGNREHNDEFSICSKDNMTRVIDAVVNQRNGKVNCFEVSGKESCGNGIVESGEECDCGYDDDCTDECCYAKKSGADSPNDCKLKPNKQCSPTAGPCCTETCNFVMAASNKKCRAGTDCVREQTCDGTSAKCPEPVLSKNYTLCGPDNGDKTQVCLNGFCSGSLCQAIGHLDSNKNVINENAPELWEDCYISLEGQLTVQQKEELCLLSCKLKTNKTCVKSSNIGDDPAYKDFQDVIAAVNGQSGVKLPPGSPCNDYQGYCDVFHRCRGVDNEGPLQRLKNLLFSEQTFTTIKNWIIEHWWAVMLMAIGLVLAMGLFIKFCAVHTPSSNPNAKPALRLTDTLRRRRRPPPQQNYMPSSSEPPPPYSAGNMSGGPPPGHRKGKQGKKSRDMEMRRKV